MTAKQPIDVEALLHWAYGAQRADQVDHAYGVLMGMLMGGAGNAAHLADIGAAGAIVDSSGILLAGTRLAEDAEAVARTVERLCGRRGAELVARHARLGSRPDWMPAARFRYEPLLDVGKAQLIADATPGRETGSRLKVWEEVNGDAAAHLVVREKDKHRHLIREFCPVSTADDPDIVCAARDVYLIWWGLVDQVRAALEAADSLKKYRVAGFGAPAMPWGAAEHRRWTALREECRRLDSSAET